MNNISFKNTLILDLNENFDFQIFKNILIMNNRIQELFKLISSFEALTIVINGECAGYGAFTIFIYIFIIFRLWNF